MKERNKQIALYVLIIVLVIIEQLSKYLIIKNISLMPMNVINNMLNFTYCENTGIAFGLRSKSLVTFIVINLVILGIIAKFICSQKERLDFRSKFVFGLVLAGGSSNLIDRIVRGYVIDFIDITPMINFPIFNIADILIFLGVIGYGILSLKYIFKKDKEEYVEQTTSK